MSLRQQALSTNGTVIEYGYDPRERIEPEDPNCPRGCYVFRVQDERFGDMVTRARFTHAAELRTYVEDVKREARKHGGTFVNVKLRRMVASVETGVMPE